MKQFSMFAVRVPASGAQLRLVRRMKPRSICMLATLQLSLLSLTAQESPAPGVSASEQQPWRPSGVSAQAAPPRHAAYDFDFLIGNGKAHVRRLPDPLACPPT